MKEIEIWQYYSKDTKRIRGLMQENKHFEDKELMDDLLDESKIIDEKCERKYPRIGEEFQVKIKEFKY